MKKVLTMSLALLLLALGWTTPSQAKTVYLKPNANWLQSNARFALNMFGGSGAEWADFTLVDAANNIYKATFDDNRESMIFVRMDPATTENNWTNKWNQSDDLAAPSADNQLYTIEGDVWDNFTPTISKYTIVVAFGNNTDTRAFTAKTILASVNGWESGVLPDGNRVAITQEPAGTGKFWNAQPVTGTWTNTTALTALNEFTGITFTPADMQDGTALKVAANSNGGVNAILNLLLDAQAEGDFVTLYTTANGWNCPLKEITVTGLNDCVIKYAPNNIDGFSDTPVFSPTTVNQVTGQQEHQGLNLFVITGKLTADKHVTVTSYTMDGNGSKTKIGFQVAAYRVEKPATLSGTVTTSADAGIEGATVTLSAANNVEYTGTTAADGTYSIKVYEADLDFTATVEATGYLKRQFALNMNGASATQDVTMYTKFGIVGSLPGLSWGDDLEMTQSTVDPNIFTAELTDVSVTAGDYAFKLRADEHYAGELAHGYEYPSSGNIDWTIHTTGVYNYKFTFNWATEELTFERPIMLSNNTNGIADLNWVDITLDRTFKAGWNAVVLPFYLSASEVTASFGSNAEVAYYAGDENVNGDVTVTFDKRNEGDIVAGVPYLLWIENEVSGLKFTKDITATQYNTAGTAFDFVGVYASTVVNAGDYFVYGGEFVKAGSNNTVLPFRAYLQSKGTPARSVTFVIGDDVATDINGLTVEHDYANDAIYNLNGQRVENPAHRGVYIINGRKVVKM